MKRLLVVISLLLVLAACDTEPVSQSKTTNDKIKVDLLFEHEGCKVYRFVDTSAPIYYVHCLTGTTQASWYETTGKTSTLKSVSQN